MMNNRWFFFILALSSVALITGLVDDLIFPGYNVLDGTTVFYGSLTGGLTLANPAILFTVIAILIGMELANQLREPPRDKGLLRRRLVLVALFLLMSAELLLGATAAVCPKAGIRTWCCQLSP